MRKTITKKSNNRNLGKGTYQTLKYGIGSILKSTGFSDDIIKTSNSILDVHDKITDSKVSDVDKIQLLGRKISPTITYPEAKQTFDKGIFYGTYLAELGNTLGLKIF